MKIRRNSSGFTLLELMLVLAIIAILSSITAVNVIQRQRELTQVELDGIAREIFVAAQNHLTMAEGQGFMGVLYFGESYSETPEGAEQSNIYYFVYPHDDSDTPNMLDLMLPPASVDGLLSGSYVIRYQKDPALVLDVFYALKSEDAKFHHTFAPKGEVDSTWIINYRGGGEKNRSRRGHYGDAIIGWYGIDAPDSAQKGAPLYPPTIKLVNAERLYVEVTDNPNAGIENAKLRLEITGVQSAVMRPIYLTGEEEGPIILDDVTSSDYHFWKICCSDESPYQTDLNAPKLYPGEDITVRAVSYNNVELTNIATSASVTTNSLFASLELGDDDLSLETPATAKVSNFRHLENLDSEISDIALEQNNGEPQWFYYKIPAPDSNEKLPIRIDCAEQTGDMNWGQFLNVVGENAQVHAKNNVKSDPGCYLPIAKSGKIAYDGGGYEISDVKISVSGTDNHAGLFATLGNESTVSDLELVNFSVTSSGGAAGALAGVLKEGSAVSGVLARHEAEPDPPDANKLIKGGTCAGGLVGKIEGSGTVEQSAAAVYVISESGDAGGLIGAVAVAEGANATVTNSYAGGHTTQENYEQDYPYKGKTYYNVTSSASNASAGGLIGSATGAGTLSVTNCYATTSVEGAMAGGLIGSATSGEIKNCYATGYVTGSSNAGAFAGKADKTAVSFSADGYFSAVTETLSAVGNRTGETIAGLAALDGDITAYGAGKAAPYDDSLNEHYKGLYSFRTVSDLDSERTSPEWMTKHYGDWPPLDTLVINPSD